MARDAPSRPVDDAPVRLAELMMALSLATDLGSGLPLECALGTCLLSLELGAQLGLRAPELRLVYYLGLLRYLGCTADAQRFAALVGDEIAFAEAFAAEFVQHDLSPAAPGAMLRFIWRNIGADRSPLGRAALLGQMLPVWSEKARSHCEVAQKLAGRLGFDAGMQTALGQIFERWDGRGLPHHLQGEALLPAVRIVQIAQDAVILYQGGGVAAATTALRARAGGAYDPHLVARFCTTAPAVFARLAAGPAWDAVLAAEPGPHPTLAATEIDTATRALADFADLKSPYLANHSAGVAALAQAAAERCGLPAAEVRAVWRAALVHDLGRVGVSAGIWGKPGPLTASEWERVRLHPYYTERILARPAALAGLGALAALNHERVDGSGYHRGLPAALQPMGARILAAADVYRALTEPRPHRPAHAPEAAADVLHREIRAGRLDARAGAAVLGAAGHVVPPIRRERVAGLTDRELEVLRLVARGLGNREIGQRLNLARKTVDNHLQNIYSKIDVSTRAGAAFFAMQHDLLL